MSDSLCILPWVSIETSPLGEIRPCCLALDAVTDGQNQPLHLSSTTLTDAYNSDYMRDLRQQFINGGKPETCNRCWSEEAAGRISKRLNSKKRLAKLINNVDFTKNVSDNLLFLDLKLGNICNLKCRICGSYSSSKWAQEELLIAPNNDSARANLKNGRWPRENTVFWQDLIAMLPDIRYMEFTGGEPFLIDEHFDLLQQAVDQGLASNIEIHYNTNTTQVPARGLALWPKFKLVEIALSIDDIGERFSYQRYGASWLQAQLNLQRYRILREENNNIVLQCCLTVNALNVYYLNELIEWIVDQEFDYVHFNMLHDTWYYNIGMLNEAAKELIIEKYKYLKLPYQQEIDRIIEFMRQGKGSDCAQLVQNLKSSDQQRKQHFSDHHPEMARAIGYAKA